MADEVGKPEEKVAVHFESRQIKCSKYVTRGLRLVLRCSTLSVIGGLEIKAAR